MASDTPRVTCSDATNIFSLLRKAGVPWIRTRSYLSLPSRQTLVPALDAQKYSAVLGIGSAQSAEYTFVFRPAGGKDFGELQVRVSHELPKIEVVGIGTRQLTVDVDSANAPWVHKILQAL